MPTRIVDGGRRARCEPRRQHRHARPRSDRAEACLQVIGSAEPLASTGLRNVSLSEAIDIRADNAETFARVASRECRGEEGPAHQRCLFFVLHIDSGFLDAFSADRRTISDTLSRDLGVMSSGLEAIAAASGGSLARVVAGADFAFDRILRETAAAYPLSAEPVDSDRDGKAHRISVRLTIPNASVRSRREFVMPRAETQPVVPGDVPAVAVIGAGTRAPGPETRPARGDRPQQSAPWLASVEKRPVDVGERGVSASVPPLLLPGQLSADEEVRVARDESVSSSDVVKRLPPVLARRRIPSEATSPRRGP